MKKRLLCLLACCFVMAAIFGGAFSASAATVSARAYSIKNWDMQVEIQENGAWKITETVDVYFNQRQHGFIRTLPQMVYVDKEKEDGALETYTYRAKLSDLAANTPVSRDVEDGSFILRFGDADRYVSGDVQYRYSYVYDMGDDRFPAYDEFFCSLNGPDCNTTIENFTFRVTFPKDADLSALKVYAGAYGSTASAEDRVSYTVQGRMVTGHTVRPLQPYESITVYTRLPEGYFVGARGYNAVPAYLCGGVILALLAVAVLLRMKNRTRPPVQTVEFYPPQGIAPADVGYIIDGNITNKELLSMVVWFAEQGFLTIEERGEKTWLRAVYRPQDALPNYAKTLLKGLFRNGDTVCLDDVGQHFYDTLQLARTQLPVKFQKGPQKLEEKSVTYQAMGLIFCVALAAAGALWLSGGLILGIFFAAACVALPAVMVQGVCLQKLRRQKGFLAGGQRAALLAGAGAGAVVLLITGIVCGAKGFVPFWLPVAAALAAVLATAVAAGCFKPTRYYIELAGKLMGFRAFIEKAELPRIQVLAQDDPEYFYKVLPYAYVFEMSDVWIKQFEKLAVPPPVWYQGPTLYDVWWTSRMFRSFDRAITNSSAAAMAARAARAAQSGGRGGTHFGGGGGGCGSW
ncbi:MAG: DUF2207 domain-containing protein [Oscillospiraceae bacterium]|nr:DUF2207 domain-containing protein [Oscillospiraceae bacterium]